MAHAAGISRGGCCLRGVEGHAIWVGDLKAHRAGRVAMQAGSCKHDIDCGSLACGRGRAAPPSTPLRPRHSDVGRLLFVRVGGKRVRGIVCGGATSAVFDGTIRGARGP